MQRWWTSRQVGLWQGRQGTSVSGLDHRGERIERRPVPRAGRAEDADGRRADGGGDMNEAGIVRHAGAGAASAPGWRCEGRARSGRARPGPAAATISAASGASAGLPSTQTAKPSAVSFRASSAKVSDRPALARPDRARRKGDHRPAVVRQTARGAPFRGLLRRHVRVRASAIPPAGLRPSAAPARRSGRSCGAVFFSPKRMSLSRPKRTSPAKPVRSGMPASNGASADFQVRGITSAVP